ncbi:MAG: aminoacyl-tRNA hydrolase [Candidatus Eremiobacteraeota bacterium]|nr:aminoacyl-tRNA hydrolase [Candidatus Eremiobacteraeota bacterium]
MGLGNPGAQYRRTRHNVGVRAIEALAQTHTVSTWRSKFQAKLADVPDLDALLLLPQTFMNDSGESVAGCVAFYHFPLESVLVVCDDINLPFARLRFRREGSDGGHNGLKDIIAALHSPDFARLRIGIGRSGMDAIGHVLGTFSPDEERALPGVLQRTCAGMETFCRGDAAAAIALVNANSGDPASEEPPGLGKERPNGR